MTIQINNEHLTSSGKIALKKNAEAIAKQFNEVPGLPIEASALYESGGGYKVSIDCNSVHTEQLAEVFPQVYECLEAEEDDGLVFFVCNSENRLGLWLHDFDSIGDDRLPEQVH